MSQPIISLEAYTCAHMEAKRSVEDYLWIGKSNYQTLKNDIREQLKHNTAMYLHANNPYSRIAFTECVVEHMEEILKGITTDAPAYFATLVLSDFAVVYDETVTFDVETIKSLTKKALRGGERGRDGRGRPLHQHHTEPRTLKPDCLLARAPLGVGHLGREP
jgi:hypothetical protein